MKFHCIEKKPWQQHLRPSYSPLQKYWLHRPGALTDGLRQLGQVELNVVREYATGLKEDEAWLLDRACPAPVWVREVRMAIDGVLCVVARSFTPLVDSHGLWQGMRRLRQRPLADMLYNDAQIQRSAFLSCRLHAHMPLYRTVRLSALQHGSPHPPAPTQILARCSVFWRQGSPLLVAESFTPEFWHIAMD
ncbi:chorismate--pyruvate lyase family protein [Alcaligenes endophyticus]|uniref:Probable chorismate pyruvate-lyase n=1 Tax=Alcaligenes endophyticus TaxID=1929088 RepID=A0ABT8EK27_9BURK|nr:chorismate lyase [Alcaligenes endophyticus]MCX5591948.1 chorismate lyase [Alcaligenes endophyticus]MDN4121638.1 chorismate lyase [Alcaligenes endophyticus]